MKAVEGFKGTKGEWRVDNYDNTTVVSDIEYNGTVAEAVTPNEHCNHLSYCHDGTHWEANIEVAQANARLIAAAPELLDSLQTLVELRNKKLEDGKWEGYLQEREIAWDNAEKAINKALGK